MAGKADVDRAEQTHQHGVSGIQDVSKTDNERHANTASTLQFAVLSLVAVLGITSGAIPGEVAVGLAVVAVLAVVNPRWSIYATFSVALMFRDGGPPVGIGGFNISTRDAILIASVIFCLFLFPSIMLKLLPAGCLLGILVVGAIAGYANGTSIAQSAPDIRLTIPLFAGIIIFSTLGEGSTVRILLWMMHIQALLAIGGITAGLAMPSVYVANPFVLIDGSVPLARVGLDWTFGIYLALVVSGTLPRARTTSVILFAGGLLASGTFTLIGATFAATALALLIKQFDDQQSLLTAGRFRNTLAIVVLGVAVIFSVSGLGERFSVQRLDTGTVEYRQQEIEEVLTNSNSQQISGSGIGSKITFVDPSDRVVNKTDVHNSYLMVYWKTGILGLVFAVILITWLVRTRSSRFKTASLFFLLVASWTVPVLTTPLGLLALGAMIAHAANRTDEQHMPAGEIKQPGCEMPRIGQEQNHGHRELAAGSTI